MAGLDKNTKEKKGGSEPRWTGELLNDLWEIHAKQAHYHKDGTFYVILTDFPGALIDKNGYKIFKTEQEYKNCPYLKFGKRLNVPNGISSIPGYKRMQ